MCWPITITSTETLCADATKNCTRILSKKMFYCYCYWLFLLLLFIVVVIELSPSNYITDVWKPLFQFTESGLAIGLNRTRGVIGLSADSWEFLLFETRNLFAFDSVPMVDGDERFLCGKNSIKCKLKTYLLANQYAHITSTVLYW